MTSVRRRSWRSQNGELKTAWLVDYSDNAGRRRSKQFKRKKDADAWLVGAAWQVSQGTHTADSQSITIARAAELWLKRGEREGLERSTLDAYEQHVRLHIVPMCGGRKLTLLTQPIVEGFRDQLVERLSRAMAIRVMRSLGAIVGEAQRQGFVAQNVCAGVRVRRVKREVGKVLIPGKEDLLAILDAASNSENPIALPLAALAIFSGLRASELRGLGWHNIDLKRSTITIDRRADFKNRLGPPKSDASYRTIPLPSLAVQALTKWKLQCPPTSENLVFPSAARRVVAYLVMARSIIAPIQISAGITKDLSPAESGKDIPRKPRYTLHDFRHAAASLWIDQRVSPKRIQRWMGHSSIQVTFDTYGHLFAQAEDDASVVEAVQQSILAPANAT